jgi:hypothetical protein
VLAHHAVLANLDTRANAGVSPHRSGNFGRRLATNQRTVNLRHATTRGPANSLLKTFKALRRVPVCPWRTGAITAAAVVLFHHQHSWTT